MNAPPSRSPRWAAAAFVLALFLSTPITAAARGTLSGDTRQWHRVTVTFDGPSTSETADPNPFRDYRLQVTFNKGGRSITVPGYFAADGDAANSGATSGSKWRAHFVPDETGTWNYEASFRKGTDVAASTSPTAGSAVSFDGATGSFDVQQSNKSGRDFRARGRLVHPSGSHHLQFADSGAYFLKGGADSPENFLGYYEFDGTRNLSGGTGDGNLQNGLHHYEPHSSDYRSGDPTWDGGEGKNIIGALNYLADQGMNSVYFLTMNVGGDGRDTWPWIDPNTHDRYDVSKLAQWGIVFHHMNTRGLMMHVVTQETENDSLLNGGSLGVERKIYYRELIARFGWHLAITWNLGEENTNSDSARQAFAQYIQSVDPYDHHVVVHTYPGDYDKVYNPLLGQGLIDGPSLQVSESNAHDETLTWRNRSAMNGEPWVVTVDEWGSASTGVTSDDPGGNNHDRARKLGLWGNLMAGGGGIEWYFGYQTTWSNRPTSNRRSNDITCEDWRSREQMWEYTRYALQFFQNHVPFESMEPADGLTPDGGDRVLAQPGVAYLVYRPDGGTPKLDAASGGAPYDVRWFDPRNGGGLQKGDVTQISGSGTESLGAPPSDANADWAVLVRSSGNQTTYTLTVENGSGGGDYPKGAQVTVRADSPPSGEAFDRWTGETGLLADPTSATTTATMPARDATIRARYTDDSGPAVESLTLIDADADEPIAVYDPIPSSTSLNLAKLPTKNLSVRANTRPSEVGSVRFDVDDEQGFQTENQRPYAIAGDSNGDYDPWTPAVGTTNIQAVPFPEADAGGMPGEPGRVQMEVVDDPDANAKPVVLIEQPSDGSVKSAPATFDFVVKAGDIDGTVEQVNVANQRGMSTAASKESGRWRTSFGPLEPGSYELDAVARDDAGDIASDSIHVVVEGTGGDSGRADTGLGGDLDGDPRVDTWSRPSDGADGASNRRADAGTTAKSSGTGGCGCDVTRPRLPASLWLLLVFGVVTRARRR